MRCKGLRLLCGSVLSGVAVGYLINAYWAKRQKVLQQQEEKLQDHYWLLNHWLEFKNEGKTAASYFEDMGYHHIAIYGMSDLANRLMEDLEGSSIQIDYGIDRDICCSNARISDIYFPEDELPKADAIVVTPYSAMESISAMLKSKVDCPVISLEEVVWSV
ncbi:MAG: hypothetical protein HFI19_07285 [Lachnospiraceae bacterium]|jgi:hypothetical protein|uniref:hypothetical protein n=1 Tax=Candidatus Merdisoma sp. JLR.KK006 TaxID=3112626 RepID=UPI002FEFAC0A|nr:hypothetical protein [Lachnospiraceae bacterium]